MTSHSDSVTLHERLLVLIQELEAESSEAFTPEYKEGLAFAKHKIAELAKLAETKLHIQRGVVAKCPFGLTWFSERPYWDAKAEMWVCSGQIEFLEIDDIVTDPWESSHPKGGQDCIVEVQL